VACHREFSSQKESRAINRGDLSFQVISKNNWLSKTRKPENYRKE